MRFLLALALIFWPIQQPQGGITGVAAGGGSPPAFVSSGSDFTGGGTASASVTAGNHLVIWTIANDAVTTHTCSDTAGNTYVDDGSNVSTTNIVGHLFHIKTLVSSATITITCNGTTPAVAWVQYSGGTGDLDTAASGSNPTKTQHCGPTCTPTAMTPTTAATILVDMFGSPIGSTITLTEVDGSFTRRENCLTGGSCFIGAIGTRVVASAASYSDGYTIGSGNSDTVVQLAAFK